MVQIENDQQVTFHFTNSLIKNTIVIDILQWNLICSRKGITSSITTIQMVGVLVGGLVVGQFADYFGRKPALFLSLLLLTVTNITAAFSVSWEMFAVLRFFIGMPCGMLLTVYNVWLYEFLDVSKRAVVAGLPSFSAIFAFVCWMLPNWKYLHIVSSVSAAPLLLTWW